MKLLKPLLRVAMRFRYPVSLPEDIAEALGVELSNLITFNQLVRLLTSSSCVPTKLYKFMPRQLAERAFIHAPRRECFARSSLFSYHFSQGWLEFVLQYDKDFLLRRVYLRHQSIQGDLGVEICLNRWEGAVLSSPIPPKQLKSSL